MASQIYSRWVPPAKKKSVAAPRKEEAMLESSTPVSYTPPTTHLDASATYSRYVPPSKLKVTLKVAPIAPEASVPAAIPAGSPSPQKRKRDEGESPEEIFSSKKARKEQKPQVILEAELPKGGGSSANAIETKSKKTKKTKKQKGNPLGLAGYGEPAEYTYGDRDATPKVGDAAIETELGKKKEKNKLRKQESVEEDGATPDEDKQNKEILSMGWDEEEGEPTTTEKKPKKKPKTQENRPRSDDEDEESNKKHERLMKKRQKSLNRTEALAQVEDSSAEDVPSEEFQEVHDLVPLPQPEPVAELPALSASEALPSWMASPIRISRTATTQFEDLGLGKQVSQALGKVGYKEAFAVQAAVLPLLLPKHESGDVLVSAATGSGKTLAYVLPMIEKLSHFSTTELRGLIVMPTRELVIQAKAVAETCSTAFHTGHKRVVIGTAVGNETLKTEQSKLMSQTSVYDPEKARALLARENRKWDEMSSDLDFHALFDEEIVSSLPDHVFKFASKVNVLICTPGRLVEHLKSTPGFTLSHVSMLVVDEADKLLDQSFQQWVQAIQAGLGPRVPRHEVTKVILSATMTRDIGQLSQLKLYRPRFVELEGATDEGSADVTHMLPQDLVESGVKIEDESIKPLYLLEILRRKNIISRASAADLDSSDSSDSSDDDSDDDTSTSSSTISERVELPVSKEPRGALIFTKSNESAVRLSRLIALLVPSAESQIGTLTSTLPRASRERTIRSFSTGSIHILIASDLVSRGLDLPDLAHVINYDIPSSLTSYVHRVGRTARAGKAGHAWTFFTETDARWFWNEIARAGVVRRERKVGRENIYKDKFTDEERKLYQDALEELGNEATAGRKKE